MQRGFALFSLLFLLLLAGETPGADVSPGGGGLLAFFHSAGEESKTLLKKKEKSFAQAELGAREGKANLVLFTGGEDCEPCGEAERFVEELAALSPGVSCEILPLSSNEGRAAELGVERVPGIVVRSADDPGIRYYGVPLGYEFKEFVGAVGRAMEGKSGLNPETVLALSRLDRPVTLTVFIVDT